MTLREKLEEYSDDDWIYIATENGGNWLTICKKACIQYQLPQEEVRTLESLKKSIAKCEWILSTFDEREKNITNKIRECESLIRTTNERAKVLEIGKKLAKFRVTLKNMKVTHEYAVNALPNYKARLKNYKAFMDREVTQTYRHHTYPRGQAIYIDGCETGQLWFLGDTEIRKLKAL